MISRRAVLVGGLAAVGVTAIGCSRKTERPADPAPDQLVSLEKDFGGRVGLYALDTGSGATVTHRSDERFVMCSTVKTFIAAAVLKRRLSEPGLLDERVRFTQADILEYAPITEKYVDDGMTIQELCDAVIKYSDNTAANLLIARLGGPKATEQFVRSLGDNVSRMDRTEVALNYPDGDKDTSTPEQLVSTLRTLVLGDGLDPEGRELLTGWLKGNTTGEKRIRAGVPTGWTVGDKTGTGFSGQANDIAVIWPPGRAPIVIAVLTAADDPKSTKGDATIAEATRIALKAFGA